MDTNPSTSWTMNDEFLSQTKTNESTLAKTPNYLPRNSPSHTRQEVESSIEEFSKLWSSERGPTNDSSWGALRANRLLDSRQENTSPNPISVNYSKRNGVLKSGGVPLAPISLEIDPHAWDLPQTSNEQLNIRKFFRVNVFILSRARYAINIVVIFFRKTGGRISECPNLNSNISVFCRSNCCCHFNHWSIVAKI